MATCIDCNVTRGMDLQKDNDQNIEAAMTERLDLVHENDHIIIRKNDVMKIYQARKGRPVWIAKQKLDIDSVIGHPYGSIFEVKNRTLHRISDVNRLNSDEEEQVAITKDNRFLVDDGKSQKMTKDDIECLKKEGMSGNEIVEKLIANSSTFSEKNEFSQAKYLKKKQKKYNNCLMVLKPSTRLIAEMYYAHGPLKILNMRQDTLAQLLTLANICNSGKYIVLESCLGLVTGAVLERTGTRGSVINLYEDHVPQLQTVNMYNFPPEIRKNLMSLRVKELTELHENLSSATIDDEGDEAVQVSNEMEIENIDQKATRKLQRQQEAGNAKAILRKKDLDGLVIATKFYPVDILMMLLDYLDTSRPFVVFSMYQEPLVNCYLKLKKSGQAILLRLTEMMTRHYQVLPDRTHPHVNVSGSGGFLLSGIKVAVNK